MKSGTQHAVKRIPAASRAFVRRNVRGIVAMGFADVLEDRLT